ncbi:plasmid replication initiator RepA [Scandinavium sp.]|uniref:plasmid replication initiator RepA n=1 Tax=Scandinavium sp. TaxID=2830653 RepID=UPI0028A295E3|nr:plasmid replication initiator RepA [Scandinavium sp.]
MPDKYSPQHWSQLDTEEQIRFWQGVEDGHVDSFLVAPERKRTRRRRGEHSTRPKCENPSWFRPENYKKLGGQLGHAYNRLVKKDPETGMLSLRMRMSLHPYYIQHRLKAGRTYSFRPEKQRLLDAMWPVLISFCDAGKHTVGMYITKLAEKLSPKDAKGNVIPGTEVTVSRVSNLIAEQVRYGVLGVSEETQWDQESRKRLPKYVWVTIQGWQMLGVDLMKLQEQQQKRLRESEERRRLIEEGILGEDEDISAHAARKRWYLHRSQETLKQRRAKGAARKRANRLARLPEDQQIHEMARFLKKTLPANEVYYYSDDQLNQLARTHLYQLELSLAAPPPH